MPSSSSSSSECSSFLSLVDLSLVKDKYFYLISQSWFQQWCDYAGVDPATMKAIPSSSSSSSSALSSKARPGPINNSSLVARALQTDYIVLKDGAVENVDFFLLNASAYEYLHHQYTGGPQIRRQVILVGLRGVAQVELYPAFLYINFVDEKTGEPMASGAKKISSFSLHLSLRDVLDAARPARCVGLSGRVWKMADKEWTLIPETELANKLEFLELPACTELLLEYKRADGLWSRAGGVKKNWRQFEINDIIDAKDTQNKWFESSIRDVKNGRVLVHFNGWSSKWDEFIPVDSDRLAARNTHTTGPYESNKSPINKLGMQALHSVGKPPEKGAVGLRNLGNTCFMNSTLQCLSNTPFLTEYFVEGRYVKHINRDNPLGWQGKIADEYGGLMKEMWSGQYSSVAPRGLKQAIGEFQPRFSGYQQHDSSELLSFLLDGLHEDLNLVKKKPPTLPVESNGRPDAVVARESWERHLLRNKSVIVDTCQGQLKSRVVCPSCNRESITFDPFMFLSVPLPLAATRSLDVVLVKSPQLAAQHGDALNHPTTYTLKVPKGGNGQDLRDALCKFVPGLPSAGLLMTEVWQGKLHKVFADDGALDKMGTHMVVLYDLPETIVNKNTGVEKFTTLQLAHFMGTKARRLFKSLAIPGVVAIPTDKLGSCPISLIRELIQAAARPLLESGWQAGDSDAALYDIVLLDRGLRTPICDIPYKDKDATIDLLAASRPTGGMAFACVWSEETAARLLTAFPSHSSNKEAAASVKRALGLADCLDAFVKEEVLRKSEAWYCSVCKEHQQATKKFDIYTAPSILILHLKRFTYNSIYRDKIDTLVDFPVTGLDMAPWLSHPDAKDDAIYDLYAVSCHFGGSSSGHYIAYAKNFINGQWYNFDDSSVAPIDEPQDVVKASAYVLFYKKRNCKPPPSLL